MDQFEINKIHKTVWVFKNILKENKEVLDYFINNNKWEDWYTFGTMTPHLGFKFEFDNFPTDSEWANKENNNLIIENKINDLFYKTTQLYVKENNIEFNKWIYRGWNVAKYKENSDREYIMMHHTDFQRDIEYNQGEKFGITAVFYLNDDFEGGEVEFRFLDDKNINIIKEDYSYKPSAGDIVVFMSGHPHYHGVRSVTKGEKYIVRTYWRYDYQGHPLWIKLKEKYGEPAWNKMEETRLHFNRDPKNMTIINNIPFWVPFEEYYKTEIESLKL